MTKVNFPNEVVIIPLPEENAHDHIDQHKVINVLLVKIQSFLLQQLKHINKQFSDFSEYIKENNQDRKRLIEENSKLNKKINEIEKSISNFSVKKEVKTCDIHTTITSVMKEWGESTYSTLVIADTHKKLDATRKYILMMSIDMQDSKNIRKHENAQMLWNNGIEKLSISFNKQDPTKEAYVNAKIAIIWYSID